MAATAVRSMVGETVIVETRTETSRDSFNAPVYGYQEVQVDNVLVSPGPRSDIVESNRPDGHLVKYSLHFPKTFDTGLEGLRVKVRGKWYRIIGAPDHYAEANTPTQWWMPAEAEAVDG
jgi:hypothetical protein